MSHLWLLGIDGGGSHTRVLIRSSEGEVLGSWQGPGSNPFDHPDWRATLIQLLGGLPIQPREIAAYCVGLAGHSDLPRVSDEQSKLIRLLFPGVPGTVVNDAQIAHDGAFLVQAGVLLLAGTGSAAWTSDGQGRHGRVGGQGEAYGDEGSAHWIGRQALSRLVRALDGRRPDPPFKDALLPYFQLEDPTPHAVLEWTHATHHPRSRIASVAQWVDALAAQGEPTATSLMREAGCLLAELVEASWLGQSPELAKRWSCAGSVTGSARVQEALMRLLGESRYCPAVYTPLEGAVWRAGELLKSVRP